MTSKKHLGIPLSKRTYIISGIVVLALVIIGVVALLNAVSSSKTDETSAPNFSAVLPKGTSIEKLGGWQRLTPPNSVAIYVFNDTISEVSISVSQQPIPDTFKANTSQSIQDLAKSYSATEELSAGGTKVYIGTSSKGPQSVIFTKNDILVLIKSQAPITNDAWVRYIESLS